MFQNYKLFSLLTVFILALYTLSFKYGKDTARNRISVEVRGLLGGKRLFRRGHLI